MTEPRDSEARSEYNDERDMDHFWSTLRLRREPALQRWYIPILLILVAISIPWHQTPGESGTIVGGLPIWVIITLVCSALAACVAACAILFFWKDADDGDVSDGE